MNDDNQFSEGTYRVDAGDWQIVIVFILSELQPGIPRIMQQAFEVPKKPLDSELTLVVPKKGFWWSGEAKIRVRAN